MTSGMTVTITVAGLPQVTTTSAPLGGAGVGLDDAPPPPPVDATSRVTESATAAPLPPPVTGDDTATPDTAPAPPPVPESALASGTEDVLPPPDDDDTADMATSAAARPRKR